MTKNESNFRAEIEAEIGALGDLHGRHRAECAVVIREKYSRQALDFLAQALEKWKAGDDEGGDDAWEKVKIAREKSATARAIWKQEKSAYKEFLAQPIELVPGGGLSMGHGKSEAGKIIPSGIGASTTTNPGSDPGQK